MADNREPLQDWYFGTPIITRSYATACFLTTLACQLDIVSPFQLYFNHHLIFEKLELWRLVTNFLFFGNFGIDFLFHMFFLVKYSRMLEEGSFRGRPAAFFYFLLVGAVLHCVIGPFASIYFLGSSLTFMLVYLWGRRNKNIRLSFLGLFLFQAPYLPWVLLIFSLLLNHNPIGDLIGIAVGHVYFFLEDIYPAPRSRGGLGGPRLLKTPWLIESLFANRAEDPNYQPPPPEERPGGFQWGQGQAAGAPAAAADAPEDRPHQD